MATIIAGLFADRLLWISLISQMLLAVLGTVIALQDQWAKKHRVVILISFVVLALLGMIVSAAQARNSSEDGARLATVLEAMKSRTEEIGRVTSLNTELQGKLLKQSDVVAHLAKQGIGSTIGGTSFCYLHLLTRQTDDGDVILVCEGPFPIYDLSIRAVDVGALDDMKTRHGKDWTFEEMQNVTTMIQIGVMSPDSARTGIRLPIRNKNKAQYNVFFSARNGFWSELIRLAKVNGQWKQAIKVETDFANVKHERHRLPWTKIEDGFPPETLRWN